MLLSCHIIAWSWGHHDHADQASHRQMHVSLHNSTWSVVIDWLQLHAICKIQCQGPYPAAQKPATPWGATDISITASASNNSGQCRADLGSRAVGGSPNVHEAAQEMDALSGFGDLPVGTPGAPTQPQSPLHPCLSLPATHAEHHDVPVIWVHQQASRGSNT